MEPTFEKNSQTPQRGTTTGPLSVGQLFAEKYSITAYINSGGMGSVYQAKHVLLNTNIALKVLHNFGQQSATLVKRFQQEAQASFALNHPNLVRVFDMSVDSEGQPYYTMELVQGITLADYLKNNGPLTWPQCQRFMQQMCDALKHAHENGVVHRDIKPSNIMLINGDLSHLKILDFGIAKLLTHSMFDSVTMAGDIVGSPLYMSPEQCDGDEIDQRTDIYSLGCVLFEVLTGAPPHVGANPLRTMMLHQTTDAPKLREAAAGKTFPAALEKLVGKMLARKTSHRFLNIAEVQTALDSIDEPQSQVRTATSKRSSTPLIVGVAIGLLLLSGALLVLLKPNSHQVPPRSNSKTETRTNLFGQNSDPASEFTSGNNAAESSNYSLALTHFANAMHDAVINPNSNPIKADTRSFIGTCYSLLATCHLQMGNNREAKSDIRLAIAQAPHMKENYIIRAHLCRLADDKNGADQWLAKAQIEPFTKNYPAWATKLVKQMSNGQN